MAKRKDPIVEVVLTGTLNKAIAQKVLREIAAAQQQKDMEDARKRIDNLLETASEVMSEIEREREED